MFLLAGDNIFQNDLQLFVDKGIFVHIRSKYRANARRYGQSIEIIERLTAKMM
jgi:hypothetical protein